MRALFLCSYSKVVLTRRSDCPGTATDGPLELPYSAPRFAAYSHAYSQRMAGFYDLVVPRLAKTLIAAMLVFPPLSDAADKPVPDSWDQVMTLQPGEPMRVIEKNGTEHSGRFSALTDAAVVLTTFKSDIQIQRARIRKIQVTTEHRLRDGLIGAGIGFGVGLAVDRTLGQYLRNESGESGGTRALTFVVPIAAFGGFGSLSTGYRVIYQAW
jgi:hypothetical protein